MQPPPTLASVPYRSRSPAAIVRHLRSYARNRARCRCGRNDVRIRRRICISLPLPLSPRRHLPSPRPYVVVAIELPRSPGKVWRIILGPSYSPTLMLSLLSLHTRGLVVPHPPPWYCRTGFYLPVGRLLPFLNRGPEVRLDRVCPVCPCVVGRCVPFTCRHRSSLEVLRPQSRLLPL